MRTVFERGVGHAAAALPVNTLAPSITGDPYIGETLTATPGAWTGADTVSGEWYVDGVATGDTDTSYTVLLADAGKPVEYRETATNGAGSVTQASNTISIGSLTVQVQALFGKYSAAGGMWDFTDMTTLFQDSAGTTPVTAASQPVGRVLDISGSGLPLLQPISASRPIYNGAEITFDGVDDSLSTSIMTLGAPSGVSYFSRAHFAELTGWREILFYGTTDDGGNWATGRNQIQAHRTPEGQVEVSAAGPTAPARWLRINAGLSHDISVSAVFDYATASASVTGVGDGVLLPSSEYQTGNLNGTVLDSSLRIGQVQGSNPFVGVYKRLLFIGAALSPEDAAIVSAWLAEVA